MPDTTARPATTRRTANPATLAALAAALSTVALGVAGGCDKGETRTYDAPKGSAAAPAAAMVEKADPHAGTGAKDPHGVPPVGGASTTSDPAAAPAAGGAPTGPAGPGVGPVVGPVAGGPGAAGPVAGGPMMGGMMAAAIKDADLSKPSAKDEPITLGAIKAVVPAGWRVENKQRMMREATFVVGDLAKNTTVQISRLGSTGDLLPNVNRWRGQVDLPPLSAVNEAEIPTVKVSGADAKVLDMAGPADKPGAKRQVQVIAARPDKSTFYIKIIGDAAVVGEHKAEFDKFVGSIQFAE